MVKKLEPELEEETVQQEPQFTKIQDRLTNQVPETVITPEEEQIIKAACPHYYDLKNRYGEYKNYDDEGKNPLPLRIDRIHELSAFEATLAQADLTKPLDVTPTRLIKAFDYSKSNERQAFLIIDKRVVGIDKLGRSTNISSVRTGKFKYPAQFEQKEDGDWIPVTNQFKTILNIPFTKDEVNKHAHVGNPYTKKYVVWHPDGVRRGHFTLSEFLDLTDDEQIKLIEDGKR